MIYSVGLMPSCLCLCLDLQTLSPAQAGMVLHIQKIINSVGERKKEKKHPDTLVVILHFCVLLHTKEHKSLQKRVESIVIMQDNWFH